MTPFEVLKVPREAHREDETLGTKFKFWFWEGRRRVLFKRGRPNEDWSEKVAAEVAQLIGLPAAAVDLAELEGRPGVVSPSFLRPGDQLFHGNELLSEHLPDYPVWDRYRVGQHTVEAALGALSHVGARADPDLEGAPGLDAGDQLVGALLLDALIGNTDRHHENWAVIQRGARRFLSPSYDHASSLGRNEPEQKIHARLRGTDPRVTVEAYARRARSAFYASTRHERPMSTLEALLRAAALRPRGARYWRSRLAETAPSAYDAALERLPADRIGELHREFAGALMAANRARIMDAMA